MKSDCADVVQFYQPPKDDQISVPVEIRPTFKTLKKPTVLKEAGTRPLRSGVWLCDKKGPTKSDPEVYPTHTWVCSPIDVEAITHNDQDSEYGRVLRFQNSAGRWRQWALPMAMLSGNCDSARSELLAMGVEINPEKPRLVTDYIQQEKPEKFVKSTSQVGWCGNCFVLPDAVYGADKEDVVFQSGEAAHEEYTLAGTLDQWRRDVSEMAIGNDLLIFGISVAFSGPLLNKCNAESGGVHFTGDSSTGKTTIIEAGCSVWGGENYRRSWRATANGIEGAAQLFNDGLLALDEISECDPKEVGQIVYALGNGRGKQRASRTGAARSVARWRCVVLSSGERTISTSMAEGGVRTKAGQEMRLLDVPACETFGAWSDLHGFKSGSSFSDALKKAVATNHGHAGRGYLQKLTSDERDFCAMLDDFKSGEKFSIATDTGQEKRASGRFALYALAGELATEYGLTGWQSGMATAAAAKAQQNWLSSRKKGNAELHQLREQMSDFIELHGDSKFSPKDGSGVERVNERAGWWKDHGDSRLYLFNSAGIKKAIEGFDFTRALADLIKIGALDAPATGEKARRFNISGVGTQRLYAIDPTKLKAED